jgi:hypothetical protein
VRVEVKQPLMLPAPEQSSGFDGVLLLQQLQAEVARREEAVAREERVCVRVDR